MKKKLIFSFLFICLTILAFGAISASAATYGDLYYSVSNGEVTITDCNTAATEVNIPEKINGYPVTSIGDEAFYNCRSLASVTIPDGVTSIGDSAFSSCDRLATITIPDSVTSIGDSAFSGCGRLATITIPDSVTSIGDYAFSRCTSLATITIPDSVTSIGNSAFSYCASLATITIPDSVTSIGSYAFYGCDSFVTITIPDSVTSIGDEAFSNCDSLATITIGDSVTSIGDRAFSNCDSLVRITIGDSVTSIGYYAFSNCDYLATITIPDSVTSIGYRAFYDCDSLVRITIGDSVTSIGDDAFEDCDSFSEVHITDMAAWCRIDFDDYDANPLYYANKLYLNGALVTELTIPDSVTSIGSYAFYDCDSLATITIPDSVTSIGNSAFYSCDSFVTITIPDSVTSIGSEAFSYCSSLATITIPDSVTSIGDRAFKGCGSLATITIGDSVTSIGSEAFSYCTSLATITIPDSVTSIGDDAFFYCDSLVTVTIGKGVTMIPEKAFYDCGNLQSVCLPAELLYILNDAFNYCPNIQTVFYAGTEAEWNSVLKYKRNENLTNADIIYQAEQKTYRFVTNCESTIPAITDYAVFVSPAVKNGDMKLLGWFDNEALSGVPVSFPYYGKATTLYAAWTDRTGESFDDAFILKADRDYPVTISKSGQLVYYQFVPTVTKNYRFYSTGSLDTYGYLYNKNQSSLTYDNDSGDGSNFSFTYQLTAGETYYIVVELYSGTGSFTLVSETLVDYRLGGITIKDASGEVLSSIPKGEFFATVSMSNVCATEDSTVVLAQYTDTGAFRGVMYVSTEDLPQGSTINVTIPINNANGDVAQLKAFVWESFTSMTPVSAPAVFPAE